MPFTIRTDTQQQLDQHATILATIAHEFKEKIANNGGAKNHLLQKIATDIQERHKNGVQLQQLCNTTLEAIAFASFFLPEKLNENTNTQLITNALLKNINTICNNTPPGLLIREFYKTYLQFYTSLQSQERQLLVDWLRTEIQLQKNPLSFCPSPQKILTENGPEVLANEAVNQKIGFKNLLRKYDLQFYNSSEYVKIIQNNIFIKELEKAPISDPFNKFPEIYENSYHKLPHIDGLALGHKLLKLFIQRPTNQGKEISDPWLEHILAIADDPRIPRHRNNQWWGSLDNTLSDIIIQRLSKRDLDLFLQILLDFTVHIGERHLLNTFKPREKFLRSIYNQDLILRTRIYLREDAKRYLRQHNHDANALRGISILNDNEKVAIIYLQLKSSNGIIHMIEGSHNCRLWLYQDSEIFQNISPFLNYLHNNKTYNQLTNGLKERLEGKRITPEDIVTHTMRNEQPRWFDRATAALRDAGVNFFFP